MPAICFYLKTHQPFRVKRYSFFDIGQDHDYFSTTDGSKLDNQAMVKKVAQKSYLPTNRLLLRLLREHKEFKVNFSLSGVLLEQLEDFAPEVLDSFRRLVESRRVEVLGETYYHSLAFLSSPQEFVRQIKQQEKILKRIFGLKPTVFANTEAAYSNRIAALVSSLGYRGIIMEGADKILEWRSPNFLYRPKGIKNLTLLLKNYRLSDDIAFRFSEKSWSEYPLTVPKFAAWIKEIKDDRGEIVNLFMDYETFGEHQWEETGIFEFLEILPGEILKDKKSRFKTPSELIEMFAPVAKLDVPEVVTWADTERDLSAWQENAMQKTALKSLYQLEEKILISRDKKLVDDWRKLQTSDHFYYMCTKWFADGDVHKYFNPYESPYEAFICFMNVLNDLKFRLEEVRKERC